MEVPGETSIFTTYGIAGHVHMTVYNYQTTKTYR